MASNFNVDTVDAGSLRYMAPELLDGTCKTINGLVDVWAMGIILYGMLFGHLPFNGHDNKEIVESILTGHLELPKEANGLSQDCIDCLLATLERDPSKRITAVDLQYHPWIADEKQQAQQYIHNYGGLGTMRRRSVSRLDR
jgi:MAP/microtubule affinity-regulating kinase